MSARRTTQVFATAVVLVVAGTGCFGRGGGGANGGFLVAEVSGSVVARSPGETARSLRKGDNVPPGSVLKTAAEPDAFLKLEGDDKQVLELQNDTQITIGSARSATLEIGRALGEAGEGQPFTIASRGTAIRVASAGVARVERLLGTLRVGVYRGSAKVELLGRGVEVPVFKEIVIAGGVPLEREPRPLTLLATERWDRRLLGDVLNFDRELTQFGAGFNSEFGAKPLAPRFFSAFVDLPSLSFLRPELPTTEPAEVLVGVVFAELLSTRAGGPATLPGIFEELLGLRDAGASWGLIAKEKNLDLRLALEGVVDAIRLGTAPTPPPGTGGGGTGGGGGGSGDGGGGSTPGPQPSPSPTASPTEPPPEEPPPPEECSLLEILLGTCEQGASDDPGAASAEKCSVVAVLIDPNC
jgi:hypothetical protein